MIDHRYMLHSNHKFLRPTERWCRGFKPQHRRIDTVIAVLGYVGLLGLIVWGLV